MAHVSLETPAGRPTGAWYRDVTPTQWKAFIGAYLGWVLDGFDFTASVAGWFGTTVIPARGALAADLTTDFAWGPGEHYFEFRGVDEAGGRPWYATTTVTF